jgi:hypothetical protein
MNFLVFYGVDSQKIDVSQIVIDQCTTNGIAYVPKGETARIELFSDPFPGILKRIFIKNTLTNEDTIYEYFTDIYIDTINNIIYTGQMPVDPLPIDP